MNIVFDRYYKDMSVVEKWRLLAAYSKIGEKDFARKEADKLPKKSRKEKMEAIMQMIVLKY